MTSTSPQTGTDPALVRIAPVQRRSADRLSTLLDAAAAVVDEVGFERITTAMVAEHAGASIGTVYRYFPDRIAVLRALRDRAVQRLRTRVIQQIESDDPKDWRAAVDSSVAAAIALYRTEPGFRILHFVDTDAPEVNGESYQYGYFSAQLADVVGTRFGFAVDDDTTFHVQVSIELADALLARAFATDPDGDPRWLAAATAVVHDYLMARLAKSEG